MFSLSQNLRRIYAQAVECSYEQWEIASVTSNSFEGPPVSQPQMQNSTVNPLPLPKRDYRSCRETQLRQLALQLEQRRDALRQLLDQQNQLPQQRKEALQQVGNRQQATGSVPQQQQQFQPPLDSPSTQGSVGQQPTTSQNQAQKQSPPSLDDSCTKHSVQQPAVRRIQTEQESLQPPAQTQQIAENQPDKRQPRPELPANSWQPRPWMEGLMQHVRQYQELTTILKFVRVNRASLFHFMRFIPWGGEKYAIVQDVLRLVCNNKEARRFIHECEQQVPEDCHISLSSLESTEVLDKVWEVERQVSLWSTLVEERAQLLRLFPSLELEEIQISESFTSATVLNNSSDPTTQTASAISTPPRPVRPAHVTDNLRSDLARAQGLSRLISQLSGASNSPMAAASPPPALPHRESEAVQTDSPPSLRQASFADSLGARITPSSNNSKLEIQKATHDQLNGPAQLSISRQHRLPLPDPLPSWSVVAKRARPSKQEAAVEPNPLPPRRIDLHGRDEPKDLYTNIFAVRTHRTGKHVSHFAGDV